MHWASANRDEAEFAAPGTLRPPPRAQPAHRLRRRPAPLRRLEPGPDEPARRDRRIVRRLTTSGCGLTPGIDFHSTFNRAPLSVPITFTPGKRS